MRPELCPTRLPGLVEPAEVRARGAGWPASAAAFLCRRLRSACDDPLGRDAVWEFVQVGGLVLGKRQRCSMKMLSVHRPLLSVEMGNLSDSWDHLKNWASPRGSVRVYPAGGTRTREVGGRGPDRVQQSGLFGDVEVN